jgi:hypothetical protein
VKSREIKFGAPLDNLPPGLNPFDKTSGGFAGAAVLKEQALRDPEVMMSLFDLARAGFPLAVRVLCDLIVIFEHRDLPKPPPLAHFNQLLAAGKIGVRSSRGPERDNGVWRDVVFTFIVGSVCQRFGMRPTRLQVPSKRKRLSGCLIVALASGRKSRRRASRRLWRLGDGTERPRRPSCSLSGPSQAIDPSRLSAPPRF